MSIITILVSAGLFLCLVEGVRAGKGIRLLEYASNRRRSSFSHLLFTILASLVGGWMFFGLCAIGYEAGLVGVAIGIGYCIGLWLLGLAIPRIKDAMNQEECDTLDDFIGARFGHTAQLCTTAINLLFFLAVLAAQFIALSAFLQIFIELNAIWSFWVSVIVVISYTAYAGFKGVILTDKWQFYVLAAAAAMMFAILAYAANWSAVGALPSSYFYGTGYGPGFLVGVLLLFPASLLARTDLWQRIACAKDSKSAKKAFLLSGPIMLLFYVLFTMVGIFGRAALGDQVQPETSGFVHLINTVHSFGTVASQGNSFILSIVALGTLAALLSTADTNLNVISVAITKVIFKKRWIEYELKISDKITGKRPPLEDGLINSARFITVLIGLLGVLVAKIVPDIVNLIVAAGSAIMVFLPTILAALFRNHRQGTPAVASIVSGFTTLIVFLIVAPKVAFIPATFVSALVYYVVSAMKRQNNNGNSPSANA